MATFFQPLKVQARVIGALILREMRTRFGKSRLGYAWALIDPLLYIAVLSLVFHAAGRSNPPLGHSAILFFATGVLPLRMCIKIGASLMSAIQANESLFYFPVVKQIDAIFARFILEFFTYIMVMILLFSAFAVILHLPQPNFLHLLGAIVSLSLMGLGIGILNAIIIRFIKSWDKIFGILSTALFFASGVFFLVDRMPPQAREFLVWNPVLHGIEWFREGMFTDFVSYSLDRGYLVKCAVLSVVIGLALERSLRRRLRKTT